MPFCTYCGQSFTRDEHLERHILTHTNVKPYKCFTCHMSFARRDLLHRHYTVHGRDGNQDPLPASAGIVPKSAGRTPIACSNCAKTKTKCDKKFPCSRCASRNLKCTVRPTRRTTKNNPALQVAEQVDGSNSSTEDNGSHSASDSAHTTPPAESFQPGPITVKSVEDQPQPQQQQQQQPLPPAPAQAQAQAPLPQPKSQPQQQPQPQSQPQPNVQNPALPVMSPVPTPGSAFIQHTPLSGYEEFMRTGNSADESDQASSPRYMPDWSQMPMPMSFDAMGRPELLLSPVMGFDPSQMVHSNGFMPDMTHSFTNMHTPMATPVMDRGAFGTMPMDHSMSHSGSVYCPPTRQASVCSPTSSDLEAIISAQDSWNVFRCTPSVGPQACPRTAKLMLEKLEQTLKTPDCWNNWRPAWDEGDFVLGDYLAVTPIQEMPRDKLLAITQTFLHKALEIHLEDNTQRPSEKSPRGLVSNFLILPPAKVLEYFLRSYINGFERYYPLTSKGTLNANEIMLGYNDKASSLLLLLMIAQGAMTTPSVESRWLTGGLTEACRISLFDLIEKNVMMASDPMVLHSALLFTAQAAWSGDKWHMDIAMGQRGMYFAMLRHAGILEPHSMMPNNITQASSVDQLWNQWVAQESRSRLIYSWVMLDQDLSLFYDVAPSFAVTELGAPMPDSDGLWQAKSANEWSSIFEKVHEFSGGYSSILSGARPVSLRDLFRQFLDDGCVLQGIELTPLHLRLLLHPLQNAVCQWRQFQSCFTTPSQSRRGSATSLPMTSSAQARLEEVQLLLQRWYGLADRYMKNNAMCALMQSNMVLFHLVSLNTVTNFPEIERLARREGVDGSHQQLLWFHARCVSNVEEAVFHCGQVLRHVRMTPRSIRPPWWAAAIYRVALVLWIDSLVNSEMLTPNSGLFSPSDSTFAVDVCSPDDPRVARYLSRAEITPMLTKRDGSQMPLDNAFGILFHCVDFIAEGVSTRFTDGIRMKLGKLAKS